MSNYLDSIPQAVAIIVGAFVGGAASNAQPGNLNEIEKRIPILVEQLIATFTKALRDVENEE
jgi:hypothetical protein